MASFTVVKARPHWADLGLVLRLAVGRNMRRRRVPLLPLLLVTFVCWSEAAGGYQDNTNDWTETSSDYFSDRGQDHSGGGGGGGGNTRVADSARGGVETHSEWVRRFCSSAGNEFFAEVPRDYLLDEFNWLNLTVDREALSVVLGGKAGTAPPTTVSRRSLQKQAQHIYGLIHARYILTAKGLLAMRDKFEAGHFGRCPRVYCQGQTVLPVSLSEEADKGETVKVYCPLCRDVYHPQNSYHRTLDGAYWGTTFAHLFLLTFTDLLPLLPSQRAAQNGPGRAAASRQSYEPRIFGFKVRQ